MSWNSGWIVCVETLAIIAIFMLKHIETGMSYKIVSYSCQNCKKKLTIITNCY